MAQVKCAYCNFKDRKESMEKHKNKYYHRDTCYKFYLQDTAFKEKEREELGSLIDTIVRIMGYSNRKSIPSSFYSSYLQPFRNDDVLFGKIEKKYKEGFTYKTIEETFEYCENDIKKYVNKKRDNNDFSNTLGELRYAWKIVRDNIENMLMNKRKIKNQETQVEKTILSSDTYEAVKNKINNNKVEKQKENDEGLDISTLFD